jgi:hypothetical protein
MTNSKMLMFMGAIVGTFIGMIIHINLMIETSEFIHFVCFLLWLVICSGLVIIFKHETENK